MSGKAVFSELKDFLLKRKTQVRDVTLKELKSVNQMKRSAANELDFKQL